jgi:hypothetical protein
MTTNEPFSDDEIERRLREAVHDPVPDDLLRISAGLFTWRTIDAELAELEVIDADASATVRGGEPATATFVVDDRLIEVEHHRDGELVVDLGGRWAETVSIFTPAGEAASASTDEAGVARFPALPRGPVQFVIRAEDHAAIKTRWVMF